MCTFLRNENSVQKNQLIYSKHIWFHLFYVTLLHLIDKSNKHIDDNSCIQVISIVYRYSGLFLYLHRLHEVVRSCDHNSHDSRVCHRMMWACVLLTSDTTPPSSQDLSTKYNSDVHVPRRLFRFERIVVLGCFCSFTHTHIHTTGTCLSSFMNESSARCTHVTSMCE